MVKNDYVFPDTYTGYIPTNVHGSYAMRLGGTSISRFLKKIVFYYGYINSHSNQQSIGGLHFQPLAPIGPFCLFHNGHSNWDEMMPHSSFKLQFLDD